MLQRITFMPNITGESVRAQASAANSSMTVSPAFRKDTVSFGTNVATPFQTYSPVITQRLNASRETGKCWWEAIRSAPAIGFDFSEIRQQIKSINANKESGCYIFSSWQIMSGGLITANVLWSNNSTEGNPVVIVRGLDFDGSDFEVKVDINRVDPRNATIIEKFALFGYFTATDTPFSWLKFLAPIEGDPFTTRFDFVTHFAALSRSNPSSEALHLMVGAFLEHIATHIGEMTRDELLDYIIKAAR